MDIQYNKWSVDKPSRAGDYTVRVESGGIELFATVFVDDRFVMMVEVGGMKHLLDGYHNSLEGIEWKYHGIEYEVETELREEVVAMRKTLIDFMDRFEAIDYDNDVDEVDLINKCLAKNGLKLKLRCHELGDHYLSECI